MIIVEDNEVFSYNTTKSILKVTKTNQAKWSVIII